MIAPEMCLREMYGALDFRPFLLPCAHPPGAFGVPLRHTKGMRFLMVALCCVRPTW